MRCGVDIIEIERISAAAENPRFLKRVFTKNELEYYEKHGRRSETLAGMFAAKEAFSKYLGTGIGKVEFSDIEIMHKKSGAPFICLRGVKCGAALSISHNNSAAVAVVAGDKIKIDGYSEKMKRLLPVRREDAHKGDCGRIFTVAGSCGMIGAAALSARASLRCGGGLVTVGTAKSERCVLACKMTEAMTVGLEDRDGVICLDAAKTVLEHAKRADAVVFGPGMGKGGDISEILRLLCKNYCGKLIIDADGINALGGNTDILKEKCCDTVITPHVGEMSRLTGLSIDEISANRESVAASFAARYGVIVVLKGKNTVITDGERIEINPTGNCGMATGGTGDVLTGVIAAFAAQGAELFDAAVLGAYIHGLAGDIAAEDKGVYGLIAGDVVEAVPYAIKQIADF